MSLRLWTHYGNTNKSTPLPNHVSHTLQMATTTPTKHRPVELETPNTFRVERIGESQSFAGYNVDPPKESLVDQLGDLKASSRFLNVDLHFGLAFHVRAVAQGGHGPTHPLPHKPLRIFYVQVPQLEAFTGDLYGAGKGEGHVDYPHWLAMA